MNIYVKKTVTSTLFLKVVALIIGFLFWLTISDSFTRTQWLQIPVCFYNKNKHTIDAPDKIWIELRGKRSHFKHVSSADIAIHLDAETLAQGQNRVEITEDQLLVPDSFSVVSIIPKNIIVTVTGAP